MISCLLMIHAGVVACMVALWIAMGPEHTGLNVSDID
jgi:hypothetical protein